MGVMRDDDLFWEDLSDAFANTDEEVSFFFDRDTGEIFFVPSGYEDGQFWEEVERESLRYLRIPHFDYERERLLVHDFIRGMDEGPLRNLLLASFAGQSPYGRIEEILSFFPEEYERLVILKENVLHELIRGWLGEHELLPAFDHF
jgi:hypothetical protein